jgi:hypothetical protein
MPVLVVGSLSSLTAPMTASRSIGSKALAGRGDPVWARGHHPAGMVRARLICSGEDCAALFEALGALGEVEALACDCGCALELLAWPEPADDATGELVLELVA